MSQLDRARALYVETQTAAARSQLESQRKAREAAKGEAYRVKLDRAIDRTLEAISIDTKRANAEFDLAILEPGAWVEVKRIHDDSWQSATFERVEVKHVSVWIVVKRSDGSELLLKSWEVRPCQP